MCFVSVCLLKWLILLTVCSVNVARIFQDQLHENTASVVDGVGPSTRTPLGVLRGARMTSRRGREFHAYRGVRYAEPPVGALRFQPPQPIKAYLEPVDATQEGPSCPLSAPLTYDMDEDCLMINVYTPGNVSVRLLPVIVYIHSGGLYSMTGRSDLAGPHYLLDRDLVLVTFNYRLGSLGFLSTGDALAPGNNGFKDQVAALVWVKRNIHALGGDARRVTLAGAGSGALSVGLHLVSSMSAGLFHRAIILSGSPLKKGPLRSDLKELAIKQAQLLGCPWHSSKAIINCLKDKPWRDFANSTAKFLEFASHPVYVWGPVVEGEWGQQRFLAEQPERLLASGHFNQVPYLLSRTSKEFYHSAYELLKNDVQREALDRKWGCLAPICFMLPDSSSIKSAVLRTSYMTGTTLSHSAQCVDELGQLFGDALVGYPVHRLAKLLSRHSSQPAWYYEFAYYGEHSYYKPPNSSKTVGAMHHDDLIYLFTLSYRFPPIPPTNPDSHMVDKMTAIWYNFARFGNPNIQDDTPELAGLHWPTLTVSQRSYLHIANDGFSVHTNLLEDRYRVWEELYPSNL